MPCGIKPSSSLFSLIKKYGCKGYEVISFYSKDYSIICLSKRRMGLANVSLCYQDEINY